MVQRNLTKGRSERRTHSDEPSQDPFKGRRLQGSKHRYELDHWLGGGGSSETYLAYQVYEGHPDKTKKVAIKLPLLKNRLSTEEAARRLNVLNAELLKESPALAKLTKLAGVAHLLDTGTFDVEVDGGTIPGATFLVQEFVDGERLDKFMLKHFEATGQFKGQFKGIPKANDFLFWANAIAERLLEIHRQGVNHGDLWQHNIMVRKGKVIFIDFGNASLRQSLGGNKSRSDNYYLAPEHKVSSVGDIFSAGATFYYLATGEKKLPDATDTGAFRNDSLKEAISRSIQDCNKSLYRDNLVIVDLITRCLRTGMHDRTQSAAALLREIAALQDKGSVRHAAVSSPRELVSVIKDLSKKRNPFLSGIANHRLLKLLLELEDMNGGMYDLTGDHEDIVSGMVDLTSLLGRGDEHVVMSLPEFWYPDNMGTRGRFLSMNKQAALKGAAIKRIFLVSPSDLKKPDFRGVIEAHHDAVVELKTLGVETRDWEAKEKCFFVGVAKVTDEERKKFLEDAHNCGIIRIGKDEMVTSASYSPDQQLISVRLRSSRALCRSTREFLTKEMPRCSPLQDVFPELLQSGRRAKRGKGRGRSASAS